jgi:hypothetical protein
VFSGAFKKRTAEKNDISSLFHNQPKSTIMDVFAKSSMFAPQGTQKKIKADVLLPTRLTAKVQVYLFPTTLSEEVSTKIGFSFALIGSSSNKSSVEWKSYLVSYTCFLFPQITRSLDKNNYEISELKVDDIKEILDKVSKLVEASKAEGDESSIKTGFLSGLKFHDGLPSLGETSNEAWLGAECKMKHVYCHYATVLFLAAKQVTDANSRTQISKSRPEALIRKYHLDEETGILNGSFRLSDHAHIMLNVAWAEMGAFKVNCVTSFAKFSSDEANLAQDIIYTNMQLMKYSGMTHAQISYKFLKAYPWAADIPILRSSVVTFIDSLIQSNAVEAYLQPFTKIMYGDKSALYPRKDMEPLVACAVAAETDVHETLQGFYTSQKFGAVIEAFLEERKDREIRRNRLARGIKGSMAYEEAHEDSEESGDEQDEDEDDTE